MSPKCDLQPLRLVLTRYYARGPFLGHGVVYYCNPVWPGTGFRQIQLLFQTIFWSQFLKNSMIFILTKVGFFVQCTKMQLITFQNFNIQTCFTQFLWFFSLKCWFKGQIISRIHWSLPNAYKLICFDGNMNRNRDVKFLECG